MLAQRFRSRERSRRGIVAPEALLILPMFLVLVALGGNEKEISEAVRAVLGDYRYDAAEIEYIPCNLSEVPPGGLIEIRVYLPVRQATVTSLIPVDPDEKLVGRTVMQRE
jgi:hypothetical protein